MALLLADGTLADNPWVAVPDAAETVPEGPVLVSLERWNRERDTLAARNTPLGIRLRSDQRADAIAGDLGRFVLVALEFPVFRDGRAFSTARELRERHGFAGDIRALGHVLPDQLQFLVRTGFTSVDIADSANLASWRHALTEITVAYQAGIAGDSPLSNLRRRVG
jgi:uncharacterized protein (DUF934 family)